MYVAAQSSYVYGYFRDMWCFEGYYNQSSPLFYTLFNPTSNSIECQLGYSYSYIGGNDGCFLGSNTATKIVVQGLLQQYNLSIQAYKNKMRKYNAGM